MGIFSKLFYFFISLFLIFAVLFGWQVASAAAFRFERTLQQGDFGEDVLYLQQLLNKDSDTRVAESGPGSPGQETESFGAKTRTAVSKYQEKYAAQILAPNGLSQGTGVFGPTTRNHLNNSNLIDDNLAIAEQAEQNMASNNDDIDDNLAMAAQATKNEETSSSNSSKSTNSANSLTSVAMDALNQPFGGLVQSMTQCSCVDDYFLLKMQPASPALPEFLMYSAKKTKFTTYMFRRVPAQGVYLLGTHGGDIPCLVISGDGCTYVGSGKDVNMVGTSL